MSINDLSHAVIGLCMEIHKSLGPGLLEGAYHRCLEHELKVARIPFTTETIMPVRYKGMNIEYGYRADLVIDGRIIVELKSVEKITEIHKAQILTYLRMSGLELGLLINFKEPVLKNGLHRFINSANSADTLRPLREANSK